MSPRDLLLTRRSTTGEEKKTREDEPSPPSGGAASNAPASPGGAVPKQTALLLLVETVSCLLAIVRDDSEDALDAQYAYDELDNLEPRLTRLLHSLRRGEP